MIDYRKLRPADQHFEAVRNGLECLRRGLPMPDIAQSGADLALLPIRARRAKTIELEDDHPVTLANALALHLLSLEPWRANTAVEIIRQQLEGSQRGMAGRLGLLVEEYRSRAVKRAAEHGIEWEQIEWKTNEVPS